MYGLLGKKLGHSFSKSIHERFTEHDYVLIESNNLDSFFKNKDFKGINVTIPYKTDVIPFLDELSPEAKEINAVNTIINESGKLIGYNTDYYGMAKTLEYNDISVTNKNIVILGNGSTSNTINYYCRQNLAKNIYVLARNPQENEYHFMDVDNLKDIDIIFNATPVGMFPDNDHLPLINIKNLSNLSSLIEVVYNPLRSNLILEAENKGIKVVNGLFMLISQAIKSIEIFHNIHVSDVEVKKYYTELTKNTINLVFIGMPMSGKSLFARMTAKLYKKELIDIDREIEKNNGRSITDIFKVSGEKQFRKLESFEISKHSKGHNKAISCGGGAILNHNNLRLLKQNGVIIFIDADLDLLKTCNPKNRPLLKDKSNLEKLYNARYSLYKANADIIINKKNFNKANTLHEIEVKIDEYLNS